MTNQNIIQRGTQTAGSSGMIDRCFLDHQHWNPFGILRILAVFFFRYTNDEQINHRLENELGKIKKIALKYYFRRNPTKRRQRKRMIEIWTELGRFKKTNQRLADQFRTIMNNC